LPVFHSKEKNSAAMNEPDRGSPIPSRLSSPRGLALSLAVVVAAFSWPLYRLARFSWESDLFSYIALVPFISAFLVWLNRNIQPVQSRPNRTLAGWLLGASAIALLGYAATALSSVALAPEDSLALATFSFVLFFAGTCAYFLGQATFRLLLFPLCFLLFMIPLPVFLMTGVETFLQHGSAAVAHALFELAGTSVFYQSLNFDLPGISLRVAPECSGIHSSIALLITSVLGGYFFLRSATRRWILALAVIPLALLRNGFRVFVIGELCVHISPDMIDSYIHHHGGPIFFVLSLIPFFLLLFFLLKADRRASNAETAAVTGRSTQPVPGPSLSR
jgi:exosortase C (VPDSG-CTERM-specific)